MAEKDFRVPVFRRAIRGYAPEHVDAFISAVQEKYYSLIAENEKLRARISEITAENKKRGVEEEMRRREIEEIGERAENLLREAKDRADRIVREAEAEADRIRADAACERKDAEIYAEEARAEALEMVKERDEMLVRTKEAVSDLREKLVEEYERVLRTLDEFDGVPAEKEETESEPVGEIGEDEQAFAGQEPEKAVAFADDVREYAVPDEVRPEEEQTDELPEEEITIPDFSPVFEEDGEEEEEDPERARKRETFPFAFDENDYYREDAAEESEEDEEDEGDQEEYYRGTYENGAEDETEEEADPEEEDLKFSEAIPDFISDYPDEEVAGVLEEEYEDTPEEEFEEVFEG
ncbi:MAG: DivIVA domain-containing protein, partial [Clostridia bacterium]|nr:DivIVA domain-containing protein [Clostridia bacterium]